MPDTSITAVVLAAGEGRRLEPLTNRRPKPMMPVVNRPLLEYVVDAIADAGIDRIVLIVGYRQERIRNHFGNGDDWGVEIEYVQQERQLGTGHAVLQAESAVDGEFVVLNGDRIVDASIVRRIRDAAMEGDTPVMTVTPVDEPREYGVVSMAGDRITAIAEKPEGPVETNRINAGVYGFDDGIFDAIRETSPSGELALTDTLDRIAQDAPITAFSYRGRWLDVSHLWDLLRVNASLVGEATADDVRGGSRDDGADGYDANGGRATVASDVVLADDVRLGTHATVRGSTSIGENASIGANTVVENAVIFPDVVIEAGAVVRDAIVANNATIGPNTTIVGGPATVVVGDDVHRDVAFGGVVGDNAILGGGATLAGGTIVGDDASIDAGVAVSGSIDPGAEVRRG